MPNFTLYTVLVPLLFLTTDSMVIKIGQVSILVSNRQEDKSEVANNGTKPKTKDAGGDQLKELLITGNKQVVEKASHGQLLLLVCRKQCYQQRGQIVAWLGNYLRNINTTNNNNNQLDINYYYYFDKDNSAHIGLIELTSAAFPALIYRVAGKSFLYKEDVNDKQSFLEWMSMIHSSTSIPVETSGTELSDILNGVAKCSDEKWLLLLKTRNKCTVAHWNNIARSLSDYRNLIVADIEIDTLLSRHDNWLVESPIKVIIEQRLPTIKLDGQCTHLLLMQNNAYNLYDGSVIKDEPEKVRRFSQNSENRQCNGNGKMWRKIKSDLTDIELMYLVEERTLDRLRHKPVYVLIGATGGIAVIVLAISIFWGLKSSSFAGQ